MRILTLFVLLSVAFMSNLSAQTMEELKAEKAVKAGEVAAIQAEVDAIQAKINALPGWRTGAFGTIGASLSNFNDWFSRGTPNTSSGNIGITVNGYAKLIQDKFFWRNSANLNLGWVKFDNKDDDTDSDEFEQATDVFNISSLYGKKLNDKFAISALGEYRTTILSNFNDPGYLDLGIGATWTPLPDLVVVFHPLNYNFVFAKNDNIYQSSLGCKIMADYTRQLPKGISWKSNLTAFYSYENQDLSNWTWVNGIGFNIWKGIGIGAELGIRGSKQEALDYDTKQYLTETEPTRPEPSFDNIDSKLQSYWLIGLSYSF